MRDQARLVGMIYEAAYDPGGWSAALEGIVAHVCGIMGAMFFVDRLVPAESLQALTVDGFSTDNVRDYQMRYAKLDPRLIWADTHLPAGGVYVDDRDMAFPVVERSETYQDFYRPLGLGVCLGGSLFKDSHRQGFLAVHRDRARDGFGATECRRFQAILPHVIRALQLHRKIASMRQRAAGLAFALDHLPTAVFLVDGDGKLLHANQSAADLAASPGSPLRLRDGRIAPADHRHSPAWSRALRQARDASIAAASPPPILRFADRQGQRRVSLMVAAVCDPDGSDGNSAILVFAADSAARPRAESALLKSEFGLTRAEAEIAKSLASGETPDTIAHRRGRSQATVRGQIKAIYGKLDISTQSQLVNLLALSLAALRLSSDGTASGGPTVDSC